MLGKTLKINKNTDMANQGKFARLCVEMNVSKPLISKFVIGGRLQKVEYEGIRIICFRCDYIGHRENLCEKGLSDTHKDAAATDFPEGSKVEKVVAEEGQFGP